MVEEEVVVPDPPVEDIPAEEPPVALVAPEEPQREPEVIKEVVPPPAPVPEKEEEKEIPKAEPEETPAQPTEKPETEEAIALRDFFDGRSISYTKELVVGTENIQVKLWDHGRQDGDVVSIYLNGEPVVAKHTLTYKKQVYEVKLDPKRSNDLFLYAHNLGRFPPNTVSIEINDGSTAENIILNSDLKSCEAVLINVKQ